MAADAAATGIRAASRAGPRPSAGQVAFAAAVALILFFLVLPTLIVVPISFGAAPYIEFPPSALTWRWYVQYLTDPDWLAATFFSLRIALGTTLVATVVGTLAAIALVRGTLPGRALIHGLALCPLVVPHIIVAIALYLVFAPLRLTGSFPGFLLAHSMLAVPYVVITVSAALQRFDPVLELAALSCGAGRVRTFFSIVLPNIAPGVAAGGVFAFVSSLDEATVAFFISDLGGKTITRKLFEDIDFNLTPVIAVVSTVMVAVSLVLMGGVHVLRSSARRPGATRNDHGGKT